MNDSETFCPIDYPEISDCLLIQQELTPTNDLGLENGNTIDSNQRQINGDDSLCRPKTFTSTLSVDSNRSSRSSSNCSRQDPSAFSLFKSQVFVTVGGLSDEPNITDVIQVIEDNKKQEDINRSEKEDKKSKDSSIHCSENCISFVKPASLSANSKTAENLPRTRSCELLSRSDSENNDNLLSEESNLRRSGSCVSFAKSASYLSYMELIVEEGQVISVPSTMNAYNPMLQAPDDMIHDDPANDEELEDEELEDDFSDEDEETTVNEEVEDFHVDGMGRRQRRMSAEEEAFINMLLNVFNAADDRARLAAGEQNHTIGTPMSEMNNLVIEEVDEEEDDTEEATEAMETNDVFTSHPDSAKDDRGKNGERGIDEDFVSSEFSKLILLDDPEEDLAKDRGPPVEEEPIICQRATPIRAQFTTFPEHEEVEEEDEDVSSSSFVSSSLHSAPRFYYSYDDGNMPVSL